jgi:hypothetical protein
MFNQSVNVSAREQKTIAMAISGKIRRMYSRNGIAISKIGITERRQAPPSHSFKDIVCGPLGRGKTKLLDRRWKIPKDFLQTDVIMVAVRN